jgi:hypothetical protein
MKNPFKGIAEGDRPKVVDAWVADGAIEHKPSAWDLLTMDDEWGLYTLGQVRRLAKVASVRLEVPAIDLDQLLHSSVVAEKMEKGWILQVQSLDDVYVELILEFQKTSQQGGRHER